MISIVIALTAIPLIVILVLAIPATLLVDIGRTDRLHARWRIRWLFGLVDIDSGRRKSRRARRPRTAEPDDVADSPAATRRRRGPAAVLSVLRTPGLPRRAARLLTGLARRVSWESVTIRAEFGFDDPASTGRMYGLLAPALIFAAARGWDVRCQPSFLRTGVQGSCAATLRARPVALAGITVGFLCSLPVLKAIRRWRSRR